MKGTVFDIQRMSLHDGPGLRTVVFLKGCPLRCVWCHNPEGKCFETQLMYQNEKCVSCGRCVSVCACHTLENGKHLLDRINCKDCASCADVCLFGALTRCGKQMQVQEITDIAERDRLFYESSGGGVTFSGGEPMAQFDFLYALVKTCKEKQLSVCLETSGYAPWEYFEKILPYVDQFLFDIKETDDGLHWQYTGVPTDMIQKNLRSLNANKACIVLRCPIIPGYNDREAHFQAIGELSQKFRAVQRIDVEPYHPLGLNKQKWLRGRESSGSSIPIPTAELTQKWVCCIQRYARVPVV